MAETVENLLARLDTIKSQKADLEKAEKDTVAALTEKLKELHQRVKAVGVNAGQDPEQGRLIPQVVPAYEQSPAGR
jgi:hypothetical protein